MTYEQTIMEHEEMTMQKGIAQTKLESLKAMVETLKLSTEDAMAVLKMSKEDYAKYKKLLQTF